MVGSDRQRKEILALAAALLAALAIALPSMAIVGIFDHETPPSPQETVLRIGFLDKVDSLNPFLGLKGAAEYYYGLVYDGLMAYDENLDVTANLAVNWRTVQDSDPAMVTSGEPYGSVWEYDLSPNARWHDGTPFTAEDVVWNLNLNCMGANYTDMWKYQPYTYFMKFAEKVDSDTVRVHFFDRESGEPTAVAYGDFLPIFMLPRHRLENQTTSYISFQWPGYFTDSDPPIIGTGPFRASPDITTEFQLGDHLTLVRNEDYHWLADRGDDSAIDKIVLYFFDDSTAMALALEQYQLDVAKFPPDIYDSIAKDVASGEKRRIVTMSTLGSTQYSTSVVFNLNQLGPNNWRLDSEARLALAQATNKTKIVQDYYVGLGGEGASIVTPLADEWYWKPSLEETILYNLDTARATLEAAGYVDTDGDDIRECTASSAAVQNSWALVGEELDLDMYVRMEHPEEKEIARYLETEWAKIGIDVTLTVMLEDVIARQCYGCGYYDPDVLLWDWNTPIDPNYILFVHSNKALAGFSDTWYSSVAFNENYTASVNELHSTIRQTYVANCQRIAYQELPRIVIAYPYSNYAWRTDEWLGWGNWSQCPGLGIGQSGTANMLLFNLEGVVSHLHGDTAGWAYAAGIAFAGATLVVVVELARRANSPKK